MTITCASECRLTHRQTTTHDGMRCHGQQSPPTPAAIGTDISQWGISVDSVCDPIASPQDPQKTDFTPLQNTFDQYVSSLKESGSLADGLKQRAEAFQSLIRMATKSETRRAMGGLAPWKGTDGFSRFSPQAIPTTHVSVWTPQPSLWD